VIPLIHTSVTLDSNSLSVLNELKNKLNLSQNAVLNLALSSLLLLNPSEKIAVYNLTKASTRKVSISTSKKLVRKLKRLYRGRSLSFLVKYGLFFLKELLDVNPFLYASLMMKVSSVEVAPLQVNFVLKSPLRYEKLRVFLKNIKAREVGVGIYQCRLGSVFVGKLNEVRLQPSRENPWALLNEFRLFLSNEGLNDKIYQIVFTLSFNGADIGGGS